MTGHIQSLRIAPLARWGTNDPGLLPGYVGYLTSTVPVTSTSGRAGPSEEHSLGFVHQLECSGQNVTGAISVHRCGLPVHGEAIPHPNRAEHRQTMHVKDKSRRAARFPAPSSHSTFKLQNTT